MKKLFLFDIETTGTNSRIHEIVQLSYIIEIDGKEVLSNDLYMHPIDPASIMTEALEVQGRTKDQVMQYPKPQLAYKTLIADLSKYIDKYDREDKLYPAGYNVQFDYAFLSRFFHEVNRDMYMGSWFNHKLIDPLPYLRILDLLNISNLDNYKLATVCQAYGIDLVAHDAMSDIRATCRLLHIIFDIIRGCLNKNDISQLSPSKGGPEFSEELDKLAERFRL